MADVTESSWDGTKTGKPIDGYKYRAPYMYYENESTVVASTSTAVCALDVSGLDELAFQFCNGCSQTVAIKLYATLDATMPTTTGDIRWKQVGATVSVAASASSEPQVFDNIYTWFYVDVKPASGAGVAGNFLTYVNGKKTPP